MFFLKYQKSVKVYKFSLEKSYRKAKLLNHRRELVFVANPISVSQSCGFLFEIKEAKELSEKLSNMPITDLKTAMGINDRFLTINELFGGDGEAFNSVVSHLNQLGSYDEAKSYLLSNVAETNNWSAPEKLKKAANFINLVQRRYK